MEKSEPKFEELSQQNLNEYRKIIIKILHSHYIPKQYLEDLENDLLYIVYKADKDFNGIGTIHGYRKTMINFYIKNYLSKIKKDKQIKKQEINENIKAKDLINLDYISNIEKELLLNRYVFKYPMSSFSKDEKKILQKALEKVIFYENIS